MSNGLVVRALDFKSKALGSHQCVAPRLTQPFIIPRLNKLVPGTPGNLVFKNNQWLCSLKTVEQSTKKIA